MPIANLVGLRISQLNGCGEGVYEHNQAAKRAGETEERLVMIAAWRDAPFFTDAERAALDLAEWIVHTETVPDGVLAEAARHYDLRQLFALLLLIVRTGALTRNPLRPNIFFQEFRNSP
jgi:AhpD family alkylhydroperoxidase